MKKSLVVLASLLAVAIGPSFAATAARPHSVDYLIGMLEAGVPSRTIIARIHEGSLAITLGEGDLDRLKEAGADEALIGAVEGTAAATPAEPRQSWGRPHRLAEPPTGSGGAAVEPKDKPPTEDPESDQGAGTGIPDDGSQTPHGGYPYYRPGDDDSYGYAPAPYYSFYYGYPYYDPFFLPYDPFYYSYYGFYSPYYRYNYGFRYHHGPGRVVPRGSGRLMPRGSGGHMPSGGSPRGHVSPRSHH